MEKRELSEKFQSRMMSTKSEVEQRAEFSEIRYAQCWEDADILLEGLDVQPGDVCLSIASAGENSLSLLTKNPNRVIALDLNPAQLACLELRVAAFRKLEHPDLLKLIGSRPSESKNRQKLYQECRSDLSIQVRQFWDDRSQLIEEGIGTGGKFETYFASFRNRVLPLVHLRKKIAALLGEKSSSDREEFYETNWNTWRWRTMFRVFFSRFVMGRLGRDPEFFKYVEGSVADRILSRTRHALTTLAPSENPYLHWILTGRHGEILPHALREENFEIIRRNLDSLEWRLSSVEQFLDEDKTQIDRHNLSDIFEYMSEDNSSELLARLIERTPPGGRLAYWNMLAPRQSPAEFPVDWLQEFSEELLSQDKAFFYSRFVVEEKNQE